MRAWALRWFVVAAVLLATAWSVAAQGRSEPPAGRSGSPVGREEPRLALVIGNGTYREAPLRNPVNDARAMAQTLRELGFMVIAHENATKRIRSDLNFCVAPRDPALVRGPSAWGKG